MERDSDNLQGEGRTFNYREIEQLQLAHSYNYGYRSEEEEEEEEEGEEEEAAHIPVPRLPDPSPAGIGARVFIFWDLDNLQSRLGPSMMLNKLKCVRWGHVCLRVPSKKHI